VNRALAAAVLTCLAIALIGLAILWPSKSRIAAPPGTGGSTTLFRGTVTFVKNYECRYDTGGGTAPAASASKPQCETSQVAMHNGPERGQEVPVDTNSAAGTADLHVGDQILVSRTTGPDNTPTYVLVDYQRGTPLLWLGLIFALFVVGVARWRGIGALVGLGITWLVLVRFMLPALLDGKNALAVALVAAALVLGSVLFVAHGFNARTATAVLGTLASLLLVGLIGVVSLGATRLNGTGSDEGTYLQSIAGGVSLRGLLLAGMVIGALGVLNDMSVTQASAVWEIHLADPSQGAGRVYRSAMRVGRDHIASTVYTLVLAYAGAALPLLLLFNLAGRHASDVVTSELIAEEVVRTLVGSIGLVACVPLTTILAAVVVTVSYRAERSGPATT
jgi:uncharacterized membrane protein